MPQNQTQYITTLIVLGRNEGVFQAFSGGRVTADSVADRSPGDEFPRASGGDKSITPITVGRSVELLRDDDAFRARMIAAVGVEEGCVVNRKPMDKNRNPYGRGRTWTCTMTEAPEEDSDSNSENTKGTIEITLQPSRVTP